MVTGERQLVISTEITFIFGVLKIGFVLHNFVILIDPPLPRLWRTGCPDSGRFFGRKKAQRKINHGLTRIFTDSFVFIGFCFIQHLDIISPHNWTNLRD